MANMTNTTNSVLEILRKYGVSGCDVENLSLDSNVGDSARRLVFGALSQLLDDAAFACSLPHLSAARAILAEVLR